MNRTLRGLLAFLTGPATILAIPVIAYTAAPKIYAQYHSRTFKKTTATVLHADILTTRDKEGDDVYEPRIEYEFSVAGKPYNGNRLRLGISSKFSEAQARAYASAHPKKSTIEVWYDPQDPMQSMLDKPGLSPRDYGTMGVLSPVLCLSLAALVVFFRDRRPVGGIPVTQGNFQLQYTSPTLAMLACLPLGMIGSLLLSAAGLIEPISNTALIAPLAGAGTGILLARKANQTAESVRVKPGSFQLPGQNWEPLLAIVLETEVYDQENNHCCYLLRLKKEGGLVTDSLIELTSRQRAQAVAQEMARVGNVSVEAKDSQQSSHEVAGEAMRQQILMGLAVPQYEKLSSTQIPTSLTRAGRELETEGFTQLATLAKQGSSGSAGVSLWRRGHQLAELTWSGSHEPWVNLRSQMKREQLQRSITATNCTFTTPLPSRPELAHIRIPAAEVREVIAEHNRLVERARQQGYTAAEAKLEDYQQMERGLIDFYRQAITDMSAVDLQALLQNLKETPILTVTKTTEYYDG